MAAMQQQQQLAGRGGAAMGLQGLGLQGLWPVQQQQQQQGRGQQMGR
jgi:hypothetical protein